MLPLYYVRQNSISCPSWEPRGLLMLQFISKYLRPYTIGMVYWSITIFSVSFLPSLLILAFSLSLLQCNEPIYAKNTIFTGVGWGISADRVVAPVVFWCRMRRSQSNLGLYPNLTDRIPPWYIQGQNNLLFCAERLHQRRNTIYGDLVLIPISLQIIILN